MIKGVDFTSSGLSMKNDYYVRKGVKDLWAYLSNDPCRIQLLTGPPGKCLSTSISAIILTLFTMLLF